MIDLWERVSPIFTSVEGARPEIDVENVSPKAMRILLNHFLHQSKTIEAAFRSAKPPHPMVMVTEPSTVAEAVVTGLIVGPMVVEPRIDGYTLPALAVFIVGHDAFFLSYEMNSDWSPMQVIGMFELFRMIKAVDEAALIRLSKEHFGGSWRVQFDLALQEYLNEKP